MSSHDNTAARAMAFADEETDASGAVHIGDDLRAVLKLIAAQIEDADRRHSQVLQAMQSRLSELSLTADRTRAKVPSAYATAFERIQDGIALLAERISETGANAPQPPLEGPSREPAAVAVVPVTGGSGTPAAAEPITSSPPVTDVDDDASGHFDAAEGDDETDTMPAHAFDLPFGGDMALPPLSETDAASGEPGDPDDPWDWQSAEALTRVIEADEGTATPSVIAQAAERARSSTSTAALFAAQPVEVPVNRANAVAAAGAHGTVEADRLWLEARFAEIAAKIETSLEDVRRDEALMALNDRFGEFEDRLGHALDDVATRADLNGLQLAESQIAQLVEHFERTEAQLSRLDGVEAQLESLMDRLSDDRLFAASGERGASSADIEAVARAAAEGAVMQLADSGLVGDAGSAAELREAIEAFMAERRQSDETSSAMLETMQQAMLSVLDRLEQLEANGLATQASRDDDPYYPSYQPADEPAGSDLPPVIRNDFADETHPPAQPPALARSGQAPAQVPGLDEAASYVDAPAYGSAGRLGERTFATPPDARSPEMGSPTDQGQDAGQRSAIERLRREFIADAQKAKERAIAEHGTAAAAGAKPASRLTLPKLSLPGLGGSKASPDPIAAQKGPAFDDTLQAGRRVPIQAAPGGKDKGMIFGISRRKMLIGAVIILFATAGALMMMRGKARKAAPPPQATIERQVEERANAPLATETEAARSQPGEATAPARPAPQDSPNPFEPNRSGLGDRSEAIEGGHDYGTPDTGVVPTGEADASAGPSGIAVAESRRPLTPDELAKLRQRQSMAKMSSDLGAAAAFATPAALLPEYQQPNGPSAASVNGEVQDQQQSVATFGGNQLQLPPASVGPLSLRLAAAKGDASAQFEVGARLAEGKGTDQSFKAAVEWYQRSAGQGFAQSQYRLGTFYERGLGVKKDIGRASHWYQQAAEAGNVKAMHNLAVLSAGSATGSPDYPTAAHWFAAAADRGLSDSQFNLGVLYENGLGLPKDLKLAYKYYSLAARSGDGESVKRRDALKAELQVEDLAAAEKMIGIWRAQPTEKIANDPRVAGEDWKKRADNSYGG
ncbi:MAG: hypothetical protein NW217_01140 [Hyphomicrobiaceae bacterium]|nr:hypothetical protein [Hyphomicrobiaceae bacterium]